MIFANKDMFWVYFSTRKWKKKKEKKKEEQE